MARPNIGSKRYHGNTNKNGSSINRANYAATIEDNIIPTEVPRIRDAITTEYYSYINSRKPCFIDIPIALKQPYSQTFSLIFYVVDI